MEPLDLVILDVMLPKRDGWAVLGRCVRSARANRSRGANKLKVWERERDFIDDVPGWNVLVEKNAWIEDDVADFQKMIGLRSIAIYEALLVQGGLDAFASGDDSAVAAP